MRLAILADIHANFTALEAILADLAGLRDLAGIVVAGDHLTGGPAPAATLRRLRDLGAIMIAGNGEGYLLDYRAGTLPGASSGQHWATARWTYGQLEAAELDFLAGLPNQTVVALPGATPIRVVHGSPQRIKGRLYPDRDPARLALFRAAELLDCEEHPAPLDVWLAGVAEPVLVCGHTHIPWQQTWARGLAINPGSAGAPLDGSPEADYALLLWRGDHWQAELRSVTYDLGAARGLFERSGFLAAGGPFARACLCNIQTGRNYLGRFVNLGERLAMQHGHNADGFLPDSVWEQAEAAFEWHPGN
jgi:predicted phosphodiesterase